MRFYNEQRHQGYRLQGRGPADLFWGVAAASEQHDSLWERKGVKTCPSPDTLILTPKSHPSSCPAPDLWLRGRCRQCRAFVA